MGRTAERREEMEYGCKICGSMTREIIHEKTGVRYHECLVCEFISMDEAFLLTPEQEKKRYDAHENSVEDPSYVEYFRRFIDAAVKGNSKAGGRGLDFGSGPSPVLATILERDYGFTMDIHDPFYAPEKPFLGKRYDLVTCTEVVEHLSQPLAYFRLFEGLLEDDGLLAIMTSFHPQDDEAFLNWHYRRDASHISFYTLKTMERIAREVGLRIVYSDGERYTAFRKR
jgi:hypothetical protein